MEIFLVQEVDEVMGKVETERKGKRIEISCLQRQYRWNMDACFPSRSVCSGWRPAVMREPAVVGQVTLVWSGSMGSGAWTCWSSQVPIPRCH